MVRNDYTVSIRWVVKTLQCSLPLCFWTVTCCDRSRGGLWSMCGSGLVSSVAAPAARPKMEEYLRISHIGLLILVKYYYFSHFRWLTNCLSTAPVGARQNSIYHVLSMYTNPFFSFSFSFFGTFFYFIFIFIILATSTSIEPPELFDYRNFQG